MNGECIARLTAIGIAYHDAIVLRRISMTLHRWHEHECNGVIQRDEGTGKPYWHYSGGERSGIAPDREAGALKRLKSILTKYPELGYYVQGDPRGCALYILRPGDVPEGKEADAYYSRGVAVYK